MADLLAEAGGPAPAFAAVVCEDINRSARDTFNALKLEKEFAAGGITLFATNEPVFLEGANATTILLRRRSSPPSWAGSSRCAAGVRSRHGRREDSVDFLVWADNFARFGPQVIGRTMFDYGYPNWGENPPFHAPVFVVTHRGQERISKSGGTSYTFVTGGVAAAVEQARAVAYGKDVLLAGGVRIARQARAAGLVGKAVLHVVPKLMGRGVRLFDASEVDLRCVETIQGEGAVHLRYEVRRSLAAWVVAGNQPLLVPVTSARIRATIWFASSSVTSMNWYCRSPRSADISSGLNSQVRSRVNTSSERPPSSV
jgi:dihydrofolate reductase